VQLEEFGQMKNPMNSSGIEPSTFWFVVFASTNYATACPDISIVDMIMLSTSEFRNF
jgi:hypothetical protein